jgi:hypothetical protein
MFVAWSPEDLPARVGRALKKLDSVTAATPVIIGVDWLNGSKSHGKVIDDPPKGYGYPMEVAVVAPHGFTKFGAEFDQREIEALGPGEAVMSRSERDLRGHGAPLNMRLRSGQFKVKAVVHDSSTQGYELVMARPAPSSWKYKSRYFLVRGDEDLTRKKVKRAVERVVGPDHALGVRRSGTVRFLRYAPSVRTGAAFKENFGEFPATPVHSGAFRILPKWVGTHIRTDHVPILGNVTCHRKLFDQLRGALRELKRKGLGHLIRPSEYAGCYNSRFVATPPGVRLSRHSWGIAVDVNTSNNQFGQEPHQDARLLRIMSKWGFIWGGRWPIPDGMHFEWIGFP